MSTLVASPLVLPASDVDADSAVPDVLAVESELPESEPLGPTVSDDPVVPVGPLVVGEPLVPLAPEVPLLELVPVVFVELDVWAPVAVDEVASVWVVLDEGDTFDAPVESLLQAS